MKPKTLNDIMEAANEVYNDAVTDKDTPKETRARMKKIRADRKNLMKMKKEGKTRFVASKTGGLPDLVPEESVADKKDS